MINYLELSIASLISKEHAITCIDVESMIHRSLTLDI